MSPVTPPTVETIWRRYDAMEARLTAPVSERLVTLAGLAPGHHVLDLATGRGEPALLAARRVAPHGHVLGLDLAATMLDMTRERADREGLSNLELRVGDAQYLEGVPEAAFDAVLCRWGLMYMGSPTLALTAARRSLRPGGVLCVALWAEPERVPYYTLPRVVLEAFRSIPPIDFEAPGTFRLAHLERIHRDFDAAGLHVDFIEELDIPVMEADTGAELVAWARAFGLGRLLDGLPERAQMAWEDAFVSAARPHFDGVHYHLGGVTRLVRARPRDADSCT